MTFAQLGPYRIERLLGQGGMGAVYLGVHCETDQTVAVKTLSAGLSGDDDFRHRFVGEIESLKKLRHPHIVQLYGWGEQDGQLFYAMEFVDGPSLHQQLEASVRFQWPHVLQYAIDITRALKHAHDNGIIHRDLKPANLLVEAPDRIMLTDFGIAKLFGHSPMTVEGGVVGTADYMAPEQAHGQPIDLRCDLYSLGTVMFTLLASRPPFVAKSLPAVVHKVCYEPAPRVRRFAKDVPTALDALIGELLEKEPAKRPRTALALSKRLESMQHGLSTSQPDSEKPPGPPEVDFELSDQDDTSVRRARELHSATTRFALPEPPPPAKTDVGETKVTPGREVAPATHVPEGDRTSASGSGAGAGVSQPDADAAQAQRQDRFTTIEEEHRAARSRDGEPQRGQGVMIALLAGALALIVAAAVWQIAVPPAADGLYRQIAAAADGEEGQLSAASRTIDRFLNLYPDDPRAAEVAEYREQIELDRLERALERRSRRTAVGVAVLPAEQAYLEAMALAQRNPQAAAERLQALIDVFAGAKENIDTERTVQLARRQLAHLTQHIAALQEQHIKLLQDRLDEAVAQQKREPEAARVVMEGIVTLYAEKPWAADIVAQARGALAASGRTGE